MYICIYEVSVYVCGEGAGWCAGQLTVWAGRASQCLYLASHHQAATEKGASAADAAGPGL